VWQPAGVCGLVKIVAVPMQDPLLPISRVRQIVVDEDHPGSIWLRTFLSRGPVLTVNGTIRRWRDCNRLVRLARQLDDARPWFGRASSGRSKAHAGSMGWACYLCVYHCVATSRSPPAWGLQDARYLPFASGGNWPGPPVRNRAGKPTVEGYASQLLVVMLQLDQHLGGLSRHSVSCGRPRR
jgi:hypothetical protein